MNRIFRVLVDVADGILAAVLYGHNENVVIRSDLEAQNAAKMRDWAASPRDGDDVAEERVPDLEARIRRFRASVTRPRAEDR